MHSPKAEMPLNNWELCSQRAHSLDLHSLTKRKQQHQERGASLRVETDAHGLSPKNDFSVQSLELLPNHPSSAGCLTLHSAVTSQICCSQSQMNCTLMALCTCPSCCRCSAVANSLCNFLGLTWGGGLAPRVPAALTALPCPQTAAPSQPEP